MEDPAFIPVKYEKGSGLVKYLFDVKKYKPVKLTQTGKKSTDLGVLKVLIREQGAKQLRHLIEVSQIDKRLNTYVDGYEKWIGSDGRVHPSYLNTITSSGRLSSRNPNGQNIPRDKAIRNFFGAPPGFKFIEGDLSQIEVRIVVSLADEKVGIAGYLAGFDLHHLTAQAITGKHDVSDGDRTKAKSVNFALLYGGSAETIRDYARNTYGLEFSLREAKDFCKTFFDTYPKILDWHKRCQQELIENHGWVESASGHVSFYEDWNNPEEGKRRHANNAAINMRGQGPAAYIMTHLLSLTQRGFQAGAIQADVVGTVHDSMLIEAHQDSWEDSIHCVQGQIRHIESWIKPWFRVPLVIDFTAGQKWGELESWPPA